MTLIAVVGPKSFSNYKLLKKKLDIFEYISLLMYSNVSLVKKYAEDNNIYVKKYKDKFIKNNPINQKYINMIKGCDKVILLENDIFIKRICNIYDKEVIFLIQQN